jgi:hypothetical protein
LLFAIVSCEKTPETATIVGDWEFIKTLDLKSKTDAASPLPPPLFNTHEEFEFLKNGWCNYKNGFLDFVENNDNNQRYTRYKKGLLKYKLSTEKLELRYPNQKLFNTYKVKVSKDSLVFIDTQNNCLSIYKRIPENKNKIDFDKIIVTSSGCYGSCRVNSVVLDKTGEVVLDNYMFTEHNGVFTSKITPNHFLDIQKKFNKVDIDTLKNEYSMEATDGNSITVTFIKDGKIYKTINDYMSQSPASFRQAYTELIYLSQLIQVKQINLRPEFNFFTILFFNTKSGRINFSDAEGIYLKAELMKSKIVTTPFEPLFEISYLDISKSKKKLIQITTDGRYYKFKFNDKKEVIRDLGYNFVEENNLTIKPIL